MTAKKGNIWFTSTKEIHNNPKEEEDNILIPINNNETVLMFENET